MRAKTRPIGYCLTLGQVAAALDDRNQIAGIRICLEHRLDVTVIYRFIHAVGDISTIADIDFGLASTVR
jgi:ppGpp synthetase/RelA/SpoT-type nucleotidyltranferase